MPPLCKAELPPEIMLNRVVPLAQASEIVNLSVDTIRRRYPEKIIKLSPRRLGMRLRDALAIGEPTSERDAATPQGDA
jgi:hypothetical protein